MSGRMPTGTVQARAAALVALVVMCVLVLPAAALATFPGQNGKIAINSQQSNNVFSLNPDGSGYQALTTSNSARSPAFSPNGQKIVFADTRSGNDNLWVMNADGSSQTQLTNGSFLDDEPAYSPDGKKIVFVSNRANAGSYQLWTINADGTGAAQLTSISGASTFDPSWSPDGSKIVFQAGSQLYTVNADGTAVTAIPNTTNGQQPDWSPDGSTIVFDRYGNTATDGVYTVHPDGTGATQVNARNYVGYPRWSPDGTKIVFAYEDASFHWQVFVMNADGSGETNITNNSDDYNRPISWARLPPPVVSTGTATAVSQSGATLNGTVNPQGSATTYHFDYGTSTSYGSSTPSQSAGSDSSDHAESASITGLAAGTTYHFRVVAQNASGTTYGADQVFTTQQAPPPPSAPPAPQPPTAQTGSARNLAATSATVTGTVTPNGQATSYHFDYGPSISYGRSTASQDAGAGTTPVGVSAGLTGLKPNTTYHVRLVAVSSAGTATGGDQTFRTRRPGFLGAYANPQTDRMTRRGTVSVRLVCPASTYRSCTGRLVLELSGTGKTARTARRTSLGSASFRLGPGAARRIIVRLSRHAQALVRSHRRLAVLGSVRSDDAAGDGRVRTTRLTLLAPVLRHARPHRRRPRFTG